MYKQPQDDLNQFSTDGTPEVISWFDDLGSGNEAHRFLSNFYIGEPIAIDGLNMEFMTGEHAYAAMKAYGIDRRNEVFLAIANQPDPQSAKTMGREIKVRKDWEEVKYDVMAAVIRSKFTLKREEGELLLGTGDALLVEGTYWEDDVWGVDLQVMHDPYMSPGRNWLGTLLMARRAELRAEKIFSKGRPLAALDNLRFAINGA